MLCIPVSYDGPLTEKANASFVCKNGEIIVYGSDGQKLFEDYRKNL